jgi:hypothetical protein
MLCDTVLKGIIPIQSELYMALIRNSNENLALFKDRLGTPKL